tara:strand:+ start:212 stop:475 length:264 start_codon:yes stop_codon:yes gene_type:complete
VTSEEFLLINVGKITRIEADNPWYHCIPSILADSRDLRWYDIYMMGVPQIVFPSNHRGDYLLTCPKCSFGVQAGTQSSLDIGLESRN